MKDAKSVLKSCWIFLDRGGNTCLTVNTMSDVLKFAEINGIFYNGTPRQVENIVFLDVDTEKTVLSDFYTWSETTDPSLEVWRQFVWQLPITSDTDPWGINVHLNSLDCSPYSIGHILTTYFKT